MEITGFSQSNPLFSSKKENKDTSEVNKQENTETNQITGTDKPKFQISVLNRFIRKNAELQRKIKDRFSDMANSYTESGSIKVLLLIFLFSFFYGILHSLGPGHGKVFIFSYILTEKPKIGKAIFISYLIATVHAISGLIVALIIVLTLNTYSSASASVNDASTFISQISYAIIAGIGIFLLIKNLAGKKHHHHDEQAKIQLIPFILSIGLIPCPGTIIIVTFLSSMNLLCVGLFCVLFIILGMGITVSFFGLLSMFSKKAVLKLCSTDTKNYERFYTIFSIMGAGLLLAFGLLFFIGTF